MLSETRMRWLNPGSRTSLSVLLSRTNDILGKAAMATNRAINLKQRITVKSRKKPKELMHSEASLVQAHRNLTRSSSSSSNLHHQLKDARNKHRSLIRALKTGDEIANDKKIFSLLSSSPASAYSYIKSAKSKTPVQVPYIKVNNKIYPGERALDGLFESISLLKSLDCQNLSASASHSSQMDDYFNI